MFARCRFTALLLLVLFVGVGGSSPGGAEERIGRFESTVRVASDAVVSVREEITVTVEHRAIRHGIFRDFPTVYRPTQGGLRRVGFQVRDVRLDGEAVPYVTETLSGQGVRVRIGDADRDVPRGVHTYTLEYDTWGQVGFFGDFDEIYWNVTGNGWAFPMDEVRATVILPPGTPVLRTAFYTGPAGAQGKDAVANAGTQGVVFRTTVPLEGGEGLTVAVAFPKGRVTSGDLVLALAQSDAFREDLRHPAVSLGALLLVALYFGVVWLRYGRDRPGGVIIPLFAPPDHVDPALASLLHHQGDLVPEALPATVVGLAVKGYLRIEDRHDDASMADRVRAWMGSRRYVLVRTAPKDPSPTLSKTERSLLEGLFGGLAEVALEPGDRGERQRLSNVLGKFRQNLKESGKKLVVNHLGWSLGGLVLALAVFAPLGFFMSQEDDMAPAVFMLLGWGAVGGGLFLGALRHAWQRSGSGQGCRGVFRKASGWLAVGGLAFSLGVDFVVLGALLTPAFALGCAGAFLLNLLFFRLMRNYTPAGRLVADRLAGFRMYLGTAERERIRLLADTDLPEDTPEQFERMLPYALALGVEREWAARFADVLERASYAPDWYSGHSFVYGPVFAENLSSFGTTFGSTLAEATSPPGSSSGSGGGGSSGGGGGGGGGGGW